MELVATTQPPLPPQHAFAMFSGRSPSTVATAATTVMIAVVTVIVAESAVYA